MNDNNIRKENGQSIILVAAAMVVLVIFVAITVDMSSAYYHRRMAQNAADGSALAGVRELGTQINNKKKLDGNVQEWMNDFAEKNGIEDTDDTLANATNDNVEGWYTDAEGQRLIGEPMVGGGTVPDGAYGIEAITTITAPTYFGGILGFDGYRLNARAVSVLRELCAQECVVPIATDQTTLCKGNPQVTDCKNQRIGTCLNIWNGSGPGNFGWLNWTWQELVCEPWNRPGCPTVEQGVNACDAPHLGANLDPDNCASGFIEVGDWTSGAVGVLNADNHVQDYLDYYLGLTDGISHTFTVIIWDTTSEMLGYTTAECNAMEEDPNGVAPLGEYWASAGLHYHVVGFGVMQIRGYQLSNGTSVGIDPSLCEDLGVAPDKEGFRITAEFLQWVDDPLTNKACADPHGTMLSSPRLIE